MLVVGFFGGMKYSEQKATPQRQFGNGNFSGNRMMGQNTKTNSGAPARMAQGMRPLNGEITDVSDKILTIKLVDGNSKIIFFSSNTQIAKSEAGSLSDLKVGTKITVFGNDSTEGVTAQSIQIGSWLSTPSAAVKN